MKRLKHSLTLLLVIATLGGLLTTGAAAATDKQTRAARALSEMGLFRGYDSTGDNFGLDNTLTREQSLALLIRMKGEAAAAEAWTGALPYTDVAADNALLPYIGYGKEMGYTKGIGGGKFGGNQLVRMQEMTIFALRGLGYSDSGDSGDFSWDTALSTAVKVEMLESDVVISPFLRGDAVDILVGTLAANVKGQDYDLLSKLMNEGVVTRGQYDKAVAAAKPQ
ncbi:MAG: S-layer homology domain-containing protein [Oscillospiraceae bacterium]